MVFSCPLDRNRLGICRNLEILTAIPPILDPTIRPLGSTNIQQLLLAPIARDPLRGTAVTGDLDVRVAILGCETIVGVGGGDDEVCFGAKGVDCGCDLGVVYAAVLVAWEGGNGEGEGGEEEEGWDCDTHDWVLMVVVILK